MVRDQPRRCPSCRTVVDGATAVDGSGAVPHPGDATVCAYCTCILIFTDDGLRFPTVDELEDLSTNNELGKALAAATLFRMHRAGLN